MERNKYQRYTSHALCMRLPQLFCGHWKKCISNIGLKLDYFVTDIDIAVFDKLQTQEIKKSAELELLVSLDYLKSDINKLD